MCGLIFNVDTNNFEVDGLHNRYHYWVHPYIKNLKKPKSLLSFFHSTCQWRLSPSISKIGMHHNALLHVKTCSKKCIMVRNEMRRNVGTQKISYQIQSSPIVSEYVIISFFISVLQSNSIHNILYIAGMICLSFFENYRLS